MQNGAALVCMQDDVLQALLFMKMILEYLFYEFFYFTFTIIFLDIFFVISLHVLPLFYLN